MLAEVRRRALFLRCFLYPCVIPKLRRKMTLRQRLTGPQAGAHQGGIFHFNPNTLQRFESARKDGADIIEMDLRSLKTASSLFFTIKICIF